jgi:ketosteroid isomerase-like protein
MSEQNKQIVRRFIEAFAAGDTSAMSEIVAEDVRDHNRRRGVPQGRQPLHDTSRDSRPRFPIWRRPSIKRSPRAISSPRPA